MKRYPEYKSSGVPWLGYIPAHWESKKVKFLGKLRGEKSDSSPPGSRYVGMEHVLSKVGRFVAVENVGQEDAESTVNMFFEQDILFGKLRPYLAKCVVADSDGYCSTEFLVLTSQESVCPGYLQKAMLLPDFIKVVDASTFGSKMPRADWAFISQLKLPIPPLPEQKAIAKYLDAETARIEILVQEKEGLIGLLKEWRQSVISQAVTKGLNKDAPMKASGVDWLGDIPAHWTVERLRFRTKLNPGASKKLADDTFVSFMPMEAIGDDGTLRRDGVRVVSEVSSGYTYFENGDVAMAKITPCFENGKGAVMRDLIEGAGYGTTELIVMRLTVGDNPEWLYFLTMCSAFRKPGEALMLGAGGQKRVPDLYVKDYFAPIPPRTEQDAIVGFIKIETARIDALIAHTTEEIDLLKELRAATISDAVLGRIDVRETTQA